MTDGSGPIDSPFTPRSGSLDPRFAAGRQGRSEECRPDSGSGIDEPLPVTDRGNEHIDPREPAANRQDRSEERRSHPGSDSTESVPATDRGSGHIDSRSAAHTAEHVLSAIMRRDYGSPPPLETHLGVKKSKCDYAVDRPLDEDDLRRIEVVVNAEIAKDLPVVPFVVPLAEAVSRYDMGKVPPGAESIRMVKIGDLNVIPCIGEHVERTSQIERFEIRSAEMRTESRIRIRFRLQDCAKGGR